MKTHINVSSMRAALNSAYCMQATLAARKRQIAAGSISDVEAFHYKAGQHAVNGNGKKTEEKVILPPEVKVTETANGKRWFTSGMEVEFRGDVLEVRDSFGNIIDSIILRKDLSKKLHNSFSS